MRGILPQPETDRLGAQRPERLSVLGSQLNMSRTSGQDPPWSEERARIGRGSG